MYNGIGLSTPRGSGTSGHVQRNLACSRKSKDKVSPQNNEVVAPAYKKSNVDIDEHNRKRQIELKCLEFQSMLEDKGYSRSEVKKRVETYRQDFLNQYSEAFTNN